jgi:hypothetical protein
LRGLRSAGVTWGVGSRATGLDGLREIGTDR